MYFFMPCLLRDSENEEYLITRYFGHNEKKVLFAWRDWQLEFSLACVAGGIVTSARIEAESC